MLRKLLDHKSRVCAVIALVVGLALVRVFENDLFYDPLLAYYKADFTSLPFPEVELPKLSLHLLLRYFLNTVLSLAIIYAIFKNPGMVKFSALLYFVFFILLITAFLLVFDEEHKMLVFYVRRFLIQPIFLLLFIPAFYFQERTSEKNNVS